MNDDSIRLLQRWKDGDESAAQEIFSRYLHRLIGLARNRLSEKMRKRVDAEDVVQSAYRSFFVRARDNRFELRRSGDLWRLLATITVKKALGQVEYHTAAKRSIDGDGPLQDQEGSIVLTPNGAAKEPGVSEAVALADEVERFMRSLDPIERRVLEMRLQEHSTDEIALEINRATRTVRRILERIRETLGKKLQVDPPED